MHFNHSVFRQEYVPVSSSLFVMCTDVVPVTQ